jgi:hypothetical protein
MSEKKRNADDESGQMTAEQQAQVRPMVLPPVRVFQVTRRNYECCAPDDPATETLIIYAHQIEVNSSGALCFVTITLPHGPTGDPHIHMPRVFNKWLDVEEIMPTAGRAN